MNLLGLVWNELSVPGREDFLADQSVRPGTIKQLCHFRFCLAVLRSKCGFETLSASLRTRNRTRSKKPLTRLFELVSPLLVLCFSVMTLRCESDHNNQYKDFDTTSSTITPMTGEPIELSSTLKNLNLMVNSNILSKIPDLLHT